MPQTIFNDAERAPSNAPLPAASRCAPFDKPVLQATVARISKSPRAPSGTNMQPWRVHVVAGAKTKLSKAIHDISRAADACRPIGIQILSRPVLRAPSVASPQGRFRHVRPARHPEGRYRRDGQAAWPELSVLRRAGRTDVHVDRKLEDRLVARLRIFFLEAICVAARPRARHLFAAGLAYFHTIIREQLAMDESEVVVCGMAMAMPTGTRPSTSSRPSACRFRNSRRSAA